MNLFFDVAIACLAVLGFCCLICTALSLLGFGRALRFAVTVKDEKDADMLDVHLHEAESAFFRKRGTRTVVLFSHHLFDRGVVGSADGVLYDRYAEMLAYYDAECYIIDGDME